MSKLEIIESQIKELTREELAQFREWLARFDAKVAFIFQSVALPDIGHESANSHAEGDRTQLRIINFLQNSLTVAVFFCNLL